MAGCGIIFIIIHVSKQTSEYMGAENGIKESKPYTINVTAKPTVQLYTVA